MVTINTQKNLKGTVEQIPGGLLWHITAPIVKNFYYGSSDVVPATYIDAQGNEQMAVYGKGNWGNGTLDYALDENYSGGLAEKYAKSNEVRVLSQKPGMTMQLQYPKSNLTTYLIIIAVVAGIIFLMSRK